ncbi:MFS transporter [Virgibacillus phasianinus]|uniref:MFS transporter n=1 Tax=Virgibacillus phasianinus TaxID=2017483 RepID=A0A220TYC7_9BACI|nr:MFS transporter [Virgibacillus phasianinus]
MSVESQIIEMQKVPVTKNRNFMFLFIAALFSSPGYYVYLIGAEWLMLTLTDNRFYFGMLFLAASIPRLLLLTAGGIIADRFNKRTILFLSDASRALLILVLIFLVWTDAVTAFHLIGLAVLFGMSDAFSYPALNALTPTLLHDDQLQRGNSLIQMTTQISPILGPALGGGMIALLGFEGVFSIAFGMLALSSLAVLLITLKKDEEGVEKPTPWEDLKEGFRYARKNELVISVVIVAFFINFFFSGPLAIGLPIIVKDIFEGSAIGLATVETSMGIGALLGAILLATIKLKKPGVALIGSLIALGILTAGTGLSVYLYLTAILVGIMGFLIQLINIPLMTMMQQTTEKKMLGRMMSFLMTVSTGLVPVSFLLTSSLLAAGVSIQLIIIVSGTVVTLIGIYCLKNKTIMRYQ